MQAIKNAPPAFMRGNASLCSLSVRKLLKEEKRSEKSKEQVKTEFNNSEELTRCMEELSEKEKVLLCVEVLNFVIRGMGCTVDAGLIRKLQKKIPGKSCDISFEHILNTVMALKS